MSVRPGAENILAIWNNKVVAILMRMNQGTRDLCFLKEKLS